MRTAGELTGLAIIGEGSGTRLGRIQDVVFDPGSGQITAFLVQGEGLLARPRMLRRLVVRSLGTDALMVEQGDVIEDAPAADASSPIAVKSLSGRPVLSDTGTYLGKVADALVVEENLTVASLLISTGLIDGVLHGKPIVPLVTVKAIGADSVVIPASFDLNSAEKHR